MGEVVPQGPGWVDEGDGQGGKAMLVGLSFHGSIDMRPEGATIAALTLEVVDFDDRDRTTVVGIELSRDDCLRLYERLLLRWHATKEDA